MKTFKIVSKIDKGKYSEVEYHNSFEYKGFTWVPHREVSPFRGWKVTEYHTGFSHWHFSGSTKREAISNFRRSIDKVSKKKVRAAVSKPPRINP